MSTLTEQVQSFLYSHMAQAPHRKELLKLVQTWETEYLIKINDLERQLSELNSSTEDKQNPDFSARDWGNFD